MTRDAYRRRCFLHMLEYDLQLRHVPFDAAELAEFVADVWPLARHEPKVKAAVREREGQKGRGQPWREE